MNPPSLPNGIPIHPPADPGAIKPVPEIGKPHIPEIPFGGKPEGLVYSAGLGLEVSEGVVAVNLSI
jgi:hypothetical protein